MVLACTSHAPACSSVLWCGVGSDHVKCQDLCHPVCSIMLSSFSDVQWRRVWELGNRTLYSTERKSGVNMTPAIICPASLSLLYLLHRRFTLFPVTIQMPLLLCPPHVSVRVPPDKPGGNQTPEVPLCHHGNWKDYNTIWFSRPLGIHVPAATLEAFFMGTFGALNYN